MAPDVRAVARAQDILRLQDLVKQVPIAEHVKQYAARLVMATHPDGQEAPRSSREYVRFGASPRGPSPWSWRAKVNALIEGATTWPSTTSGGWPTRPCATA